MLCTGGTAGKNKIVKFGKDIKMEVVSFMRLIPDSAEFGFIIYNQWIVKHANEKSGLWCLFLNSLTVCKHFINSGFSSMELVPFGEVFYFPLPNLLNEDIPEFCKQQWNIFRIKKNIKGLKLRLRSTFIYHLSIL